MKRALIIPTYNEAKNIGPLLTQVIALELPNLHVVVVDDDSPDGTSSIVKDFCAKFPNIHLLTRKGARGRGTAGIVGFQFARNIGADEIVEMDADFSHPPGDLPKLFAGLLKADIVVASRLIEGSVDERPALRRWITVLANLYARFLLERREHKSRIVDWTTGYRAYRKSVFDRVLPENLISQGPSIVQELLYRALNAGCTAMEIPFHMIDRKEGTSSFNSKVARQSILSIPAYRVLFQPKHAQLRLPGHEGVEMKTETSNVYRMEIS